MSLEMEEGTDGNYIPKPETPNELYRIMTYFPVDGKSPKTIENYTSQRRSYPEQESEGSSAATLSPNASVTSLPKSCPSCGGGMLVSSTPGLHGTGSKREPIPTALRCRKCGKNMRVHVSNTSLPEKSRTNQKNHQSSHLKPSSSLPPNVSLSTQANHTSQPVNSLHTNDLHSGTLKASSGTLTRSDTHLEKDKARDFAIKLYRLNGYTKDEVAPELSKK